MSQPIVLAMTGASGAVYAVRLLQLLCESGHNVHLLISGAATEVMQQELDLRINLSDFDPAALFGAHRLRPQALPNAAALAERVSYHHTGNWMAPVASGSALTQAMVVCPCSGSTLSAIVHGAGNNLIHRAADVHLKERRKLVLVPRETPLSLPYLENLRAAAAAGAVVLPAMPGWYHDVQSLDDLVDFIVARILDQLGIEHTLTRRWGS